MLREFFTNPAKKRLLENVFSLSILKGANYLLPLIVLPYILRVLGPEKFGLVVFSQAFAQYFVILTDFGFDISATREISLHRENRRQVAQIFSSVILIKLILMLVSLGILLIITGYFTRFQDYREIYFFAFGMVLGNVLFPTWFFQGMERMKYVTILNITARLIFTLSIFFLIRRQDDFLLVPLLNSLGFIIAGILGLWIVFRHFRIAPVLPSLSVMLYHLKDSFHFFISRFSLSLYTITNTFVLGLFTNDTIVGYYGAADKIIKAVESLLHPAAQAFYPYMSKQRDIPLFKKVFTLVVVGALIVFLVLIVFGAQVMKFIGGNQFSETVTILKLFALEIPIVFMSTFLGLPLLAALGYKWHFNYSVISASLIHVILVGLMSTYYYFNPFPPMTYVVILIIITIFTEFLILIFRSVPVWRHNILQDAEKHS